MLGVGCWMFDSAFFIPMIFGRNTRRGKQLSAAAPDIRFHSRFNFAWEKVFAKMADFLKQ
jgi:hypothetical protein